MKLNIAWGMFGGMRQRIAIGSMIPVSLLLFLSLAPFGAARFTPNGSDLGVLEGSVLAERVIDFDTDKSMLGDILVVYSERNETGGMDISLAEMGDEGWVFMPVEVPVSSTSTTSITFMEDSRGVYWIAYATFRILERDGVDRMLNTSIWLIMSPDRGASWSRPFRAVRYTSSHMFNSGIWDLSLAEDLHGGLWLVWNHIYRRARDTYYSKSDDMGSSWTEARIFSSEIEYCKGVFTDHLGDLHIILGDLVYLGRVRLAQFVSAGCGEDVDCGFSDTGRTLAGIESLTTSVSYAGLFSETGQNSTRVWIAWIDSSLKGPGESWDPDEQSLLNLAYSLDAGSTWQLYGYLTVPRTGTPGNEYIVVAGGTDEGNGTEVCVFWLSYEHELISYASIPEVAGLPFMTSVIASIASLIIWISKVKGH